MGYLEVGEKGSSTGRRRTPVKSGVPNLDFGREKSVPFSLILRWGSSVNAAALQHDSRAASECFYARPLLKQSQNGYRGRRRASNGEAPPTHREGRKRPSEARRPLATI